MTISSILRDHWDKRSNEAPAKGVDLTQMEDRVLFDANMGPMMPEPLAEANQAEVHLIAPMSSSADARQLAFPGAEGMGAYAQGGRGGDVYVVTNLQDSGAGSLRHGVDSAIGPRTIVFQVNGTIELESRLIIDQPYLTIAGQTAPGEGITISGQTVILQDTHDIIMRYLRIRPGDDNPLAPHTHDALTIANSHDIMIDHMSLSWAIDEVLNTSNVENITVQWSVISEPLDNSVHPKGGRGYNSLSTRTSISMHHNLIAHGGFRMPRLNDGSQFDLANNVIYNWSKSMPISVGKEGAAPSAGNIQNNVFIAGPSMGSFNPNMVFWGKDASEVFFDGNVLDADMNGEFNPDSTIEFRSNDQATMVSQRFDFAPITLQSANDAYNSVLESAGASALRDTVDARVVNEVRTQTGQVIDSPSEVGGLPGFTVVASRLDSDQDGLPDYWENSISGLNAHDDSDSVVDTDGNGWTALEEYFGTRTQEGMRRLKAAAPSTPVTEVEPPRSPLSGDGSDGGIVESPWRFLHQQEHTDDEENKKA